MLRVRQSANVAFWMQWTYVEYQHIRQAVRVRPAGPGIGGIVAHILIVEDDRAESVSLARIVEEAGHVAFFASGGEEALEVYVRGGIDIVVTGLRMPNGDGLELIETLMLLRRKPAIIVVSGRGPDELAVATSKGALVVFSKPVDPDELLEAIAQAAPGSDDTPESGQGSL